MTRSTSQRWLAVLALAASTNAGGPLSAQAPTRGIATSAPRAPRLLSDCDVTVESCGGDPTLVDGGGGSGTGSSGSGTDSYSPVCGAGTRTECRRDTVTRCLKWVTQTVTVNASVTGGGGTVTMICAESATTVFISYWS